MNDPAYRYKMPRITGKVEGLGNGIKTVLTNITDVADALKREAPEITNFFGCELGAQTSYGTDDRAIIPLLKLQNLKKLSKVSNLENIHTIMISNCETDLFHVNLFDHCCVIYSHNNPNLNAQAKLYSEGNTQALSTQA